MRSDDNAHRVQRALSPIEEGLLFHYFYEADGAYVDQMVCDLVGPVDVPLFQEAIQRLVSLHESLRTCYFRGPGVETRCGVRESSATPISVVDLSAEGDPRALVSQRITADAEARLDLSKQVSRCALYRLEERLYVFAWTYHHAVADSWTLRLLQEQFCDVYRALLDGTPDGAKASPYSAYADWIASQDRNATLSWWAAFLKRLTPRKATEPTSPAMPGDVAGLHVTLPAEVRDAVESVRRRHKVTRNVVLLAAWGVLALDQQKTRDCLLGCVVHGRSIPVRGIENVAGVCANTVPVVITDSMLLGDLFAELQRHVFAASARSYLAVSDVLATAGLGRRDLHSVVNFTIDEPTVRNKNADHLPFEITNIGYSQAANFDAYLDVEADATGIALTIHFDRKRRHFADAAVARKCEQIMRYFASHSEATVRDALDVLLMDASDYDVAFAFDAPAGERSRL
ncbi:MAG TPA: condensation domain-containing protein [Vicinamibacterales bacterium]|nr:condensation domain-containing protein [Vicinamibacterales bacterium]